MKLVLTLCIGISTLAFLGCQREQDQIAVQATIVASLQRNIGKAYTCNVQSSAALRLTKEREIWRMEQKSWFFFANNGTSFALRETSADSFETLISFSHRANGAEHLVRETALQEPAKWKCDFYVDNEFPIWAEGVFPRGGWSAISQVNELLNVFGETRITERNGIAELKWDDIPEAVKGNMLTQLGIFGIEPEEKTEVRLEIDISQGVPRSLGVFWGEGESVVTVFSDFSFESGEPQRISEKMRVKLNLPESYKCQCDLSEPQKRSG